MEFKLENLKDGMMVVDRRGWIFLYLNNKFYNKNFREIVNNVSSVFKEDLTYYDDFRWIDIMKVYKAFDGFDNYKGTGYMIAHKAFTEFKNNKELIWKRE